MTLVDGQDPDDQKPVVICVDDDKQNLNALARVLRARCEVLVAANGYEALELVQAHPDVACVLADLRMPGMPGPQLLARVAQIRPQCRRAVVTGFPESEELIKAINAGHLHYVITKPWKLQDLLQVVEQLVVTFRLERDNGRLVDELRVANTRLREHERQLEAEVESRGREINAAAAQLAQMGSQLDALTLRDPLTGLYTHRAFQERLREEVARALRYGQPMSLLVCDIDGFATVNYDLGYQVGDDILRRIAVLLQEDPATAHSRASDIVARYSGEEFVILLPETTKAGALVRAQRLGDAVAGADMPGGRRMSMSIGVAGLPDDAADPESLLTAAEAAVRGAKRAGPGHVHSFSSADTTDRSSSNASARLKRVSPQIDRFRPYQERMHEVTAILNRDRSLSCLLVDLSRLHRVELDLGVAHHSEIYDHAAAVLDRLRGAVLDPSDLICRTGDGDGYFVVLAPRPTHIDLEELSDTVERAIEESLADKVLELLREQPRITVGSARVLGNSLIRPERLAARLFVEAADSARNLRERKAHRDRSTLQDLVLGDGITSVYQPIVDMGTGDIFAYEALSRGPRNTALESPATLFAIADEVDLTVELDRACFRGALRNAKTLEPVHRLFVNLLPMSFYDAAFIEVEVGNLLSAAGLTPANIVFEITERLAIENFASFKRALAAYTAMGFGIAIDDVGTRHSNLETVMSLRPHFIKLSDVLVRGIARSTVKREMMRSLRHIAETIDAVMVAEGIEHVEDVVALRELGIRYGQGYYMARPAPPFITLKDEIRAELRAIAPGQVSSPSIVLRRDTDDRDDEDEDDDGDIPIKVQPASNEARIPRASTQPTSTPTFPNGAMAAGSTSTIPIPKNAFGRAEDEITNDFQLPYQDPNRPRPRASEPPQSQSEIPLASLEAAISNTAESAAAPAPPWQPLVDDEARPVEGADGEAAPLLDSLRTPGTPSETENDGGGERGQGSAGLN